MRPDVVLRKRPFMRRAAHVLASPDLNGSVPAELSARDGERTPHSFNAATARKYFRTICRIPVRPFDEQLKEKP
jgi:hypothetical protein